jgi:hypothetical protein
MASGRIAERARDVDPVQQARAMAGRALIYGILILWAFLSLLPI